MNHIQIEKLRHVDRRNYEEVVHIDADADLLIDLLTTHTILLSDIGTFKDNNNRRKLIAYTFSLNPTILPLLKVIYSSHKETFISIFRESHLKVNTIHDTGSRNDMPCVNISMDEISTRLAQLVVLRVAAPCIFGMYAPFGTGKDYLMASVVQKVYAIVLSQAIQEMNYSACETSRLLNRVADTLRKDGTEILYLYKWLELGGKPDGCRDDGSIIRSWVDTHWRARNAEFEWEREILQLIVKPVVSLYTITVKRLQNCFAAKKYPKNRDLCQLYEAWNGTSRLKSKVLDASKNRFFVYKVVWFDAWLYSGTDCLWAGLIKTLHEAVEDHYGPDYSHAAKRARLYVSLFYLAMGSIATVVAVYFWLLLQLSKIYSVISVVAFITTAVGAISKGFLAARSFAYTAATRSQAIEDEASIPKYTERLGYMNSIKMELQKLGKYLVNPYHVDFWDYLVPSLFNNYELLSHPTRKILKFIRGKTPSRTLLPCRLIILVSDLDRCPPDKSAEVLKALVLLTENTPFIVFVAGDASGLSSDIETYDGKHYANSGSSGFMYLDRMVDIPFAIPTWGQEEKVNIAKEYFHPIYNKR
eukprot:CAMPEP_0185044064 /NCGR_PEP_ID=MMETSP1103-20130426/43246_1 /TAXON_ID=36769 /ORGANISM="Paraphysomonas bandaiensis, Strain Caron Lab Isolate" /LENGTH=585 /DNA_ID=CAMNT_0027584295 /DNA_START=397 /DNA_END=2154 /DNA_ORIENTATION=-